MKSLKFMLLYFLNDIHLTITRVSLYYKTYVLFKKYNNTTTWAIGELHGVDDESHKNIPTQNV